MRHEANGMSENTSRQSLTPHASCLMPGVRALLLAAGESRRMGTPKQLLDWDGQELVAYQVEQLRAAGADEVIVVLGHEAAAVARGGGAAGGRGGLNPECRSRRARCVRVAARGADDDTQGLTRLNVDQPRPAALVRRVLEAHLDGGALITTPAQGGRRGHPVIFAGSLLPQLRAVDDASEGLRAVVRRNADHRLI